MGVAAKWLQENSFVCPDNHLDNVANLGMESPHVHNEGCEQGRYSRVGQTAEYLCPERGMVLQNYYRGDMAGPNLFASREAARRWLRA